MTRINKKAKVGIIVALASVGTFLICMLMILSVLGAISLPFFLTPKLSQEQRQEIIDTFAGYDNGEVIYNDGTFIFLPDRTIDVRSIKYNGQECYLISCGAESFYAYTREWSDFKHFSLNLLEITYAENEITYIDTLRNLPRPNSFSEFCIENKFYCGVFSGYYYVYDFDEKAYTTMPKAELDELREAQNQYEFEVIDKFFHRKHYIEITDKSTQEKKSITMDSLNSFSEGQYILSLDPYLTSAFFRRVVEKDDDIYILGMILLDPLVGPKHQYVVLKYDFESDTLSYCSSMSLFWDEPLKMVIL